MARSCGKVGVLVRYTWLGPGFLDDNRAPLREARGGGCENNVDL
jgi:hypothetical protein